MLDRNIFQGAAAIYRKDEVLRGNIDHVAQGLVRVTLLDVVADLRLPLQALAVRRTKAKSATISN